jgi:hypothetical protein
MGQEHLVTRLLLQLAMLIMMPLTTALAVHIVAVLQHLLVEEPLTHQQVLVATLTDLLAKPVAVDL